MYIKKVIIEKDQKTTESFAFNKRLSVVRGSPELYDVVKLLLGKREEAPTIHSVRFYAEVLLDKKYCIKGEKNKGERLFNVSAFCENTECLDEYFDSLNQNEEMAESLFFSNFKRQNYPHRLVGYMDVFKYYPSGNFNTLTNGFGLTRSFRGFVTQYIKNFKPLRIREDKDIYLKLSGSGRFSAGYLNSEESVCLSETENTLYHYFSFISIADFWDRCENIRNMHSLKKPLIISALLERIDQSVNLDDVLKRTNALNRQTIIFTAKEHVTTKYNIESKSP